MDERLTELETLQAQSVILRHLILFNITSRFERSEQTENIVLMQLQPLAKFGNSDFIDVAIELFQDVERMGDRLNDVIGLLAPHHDSSRLHFAKD